MGISFIRLSVALVAAVALLSASSCGSQAGSLNELAASTDTAERSTSGSRNGDYWYFDRGIIVRVNLLKSPILSLKVALSTSDTAAAPAVCGAQGTQVKAGPAPRIALSIKDGALSVASSAPYDKVGVRYEDATETFCTTASAGQYRLRARQVQGLVVRMKSDGSKWYFDNAGQPVPASSKWFTDMD